MTAALRFAANGLRTLPGPALAYARPLAVAARSSALDWYGRGILYWLQYL